MDTNTKNNSIGAVITIGLTVIILLGVFLFLMYLNKSTKKESDVVISGDNFQIKGMYGKTFNFKDVASIELKDSIPAIGNKNNGAGLGEVKKGYYEISGMGECLLFIHVNRGPYLYITVGDTKIIMNYSDADKTQQLHKDLAEKWKK